MTTTEKTASLAEALVEFQAALPVVSKNKTNPAFKSKYADLAEVSKAAFPRLAQFGLAFTAFPMLNADGEMVLLYKLRHAPSGEVESGEYRLPQGKPQEVGSAITYGRRQCLCAVTGIVADDDDDANAAKDTTTENPRSGRTMQRQSGQNGNGRAAPDTSEAGRARDALQALAAERGHDWILVRKAFAKQAGEPLASHQNAEFIRSFTESLRSDPAHVLGDPAPQEAKT